MSSELRMLFPDFRKIAEEWVDAIRQAGLGVHVTSTTRTYTEQARLFRAWQRGESRFPAAPPGTSLHEWGLAVDLAVTPEVALPVLGGIWERLHLGRWGGHFQDPIHFEASAAVKKKAGWVKGKSLVRGDIAEQALQKAGFGEAQFSRDVGAVFEGLLPWWVSLGKEILR